MTHFTAKWLVTIDIELTTDAIILMKEFNRIDHNN